MTKTELFELLDPGHHATVQGWLDNGKGCAVYRNQDLGHVDLGHRQFVSFGTPEAQIETPEPPSRLPDIGGAINWRYALEGAVTS
jgi:hypothetical protein